MDRILKVFRILGSKNGLLDPVQIIVISVSALFGIIFESIVLLIICPAFLFLLTFAAKRYFNGREEWPTYISRLLTNPGGGYNLNDRDSRRGGSEIIIHKQSLHPAGAAQGRAEAARPRRGDRGP
jgi:hypothetical protein